MSSEHKELKFCIFCKERLQKAKKNIFCAMDSCREKDKSLFRVPIEKTPNEVEKEFGHLMKYCYNCSEELVTTEDGKKLCIDGCDRIRINLQEGIYVSFYYYCIAMHPF